MYKYFKYLAYSVLSLAALSCEKDKNEEHLIVSDYKGSYQNIGFSETLIEDFTPGVYRESDIPESLKQLSYGRMEINFVYMGGALNSFMPILYYGSINKNYNDNAIEETQDHLVVEIGHYNVIPFAVENLFYTICYDRYPLYCRDTFVPVVSGENYTFVLDKRPEGIILQLLKDETIVNSMPSAFFPDSSQLFFADVTRKIQEERGDSLEIVFMVGQGFVGFDKGMRNFNGQVSGVRIYKYELSGDTGYELSGVKNQHFAGQQIQYSVRDRKSDINNPIRMKYDFQSYIYSDGYMTETGKIQRFVIDDLQNNQQLTANLTTENIGLYEVYIETIGEFGQVARSTHTPFRIWVYPESWAFDY